MEPLELKAGGIHLGLSENPDRLQLENLNLDIWRQNNPFPENLNKTIFISHAAILSYQDVRDNLIKLIADFEQEPGLVPAATKL